jgi:Protein of unknown function (DUF429)
VRERGERLAQRFLGLELSGAKNHKTAVSVLEFYPKEKKVFLLDIHDRVAAREGQSSDDALLELVNELSPGLALMGVNVPLSLPPCFTCSSNQCRKSCRAPATQWMERFAKKRPQRKGDLVFTPYTQRPVELWIRHEILESVHKTLKFEVDETLGGNRAPLAARMHYLQRHLDREKLVEVLPKLTALRLCLQLGIDRRVLARYRRLEEGSHARMQLLESLVEKRGIFIYDRDLKKLSQSLPAFDSFLCAYTALLSHEGLCERPPRGFPEASGWVQYPSLQS